MRSPRGGAPAACASAREIARAIERMAEEISADLAGADPVVLAVMHGGAFAAVEICRRLRFPYELDFVHVTRYARGTRGGEIEWRVRPSAELSGRTVLVVDDVLDRGHTLRALGAELKKVGVARQRTAVLVVKRIPKRARQTGDRLPRRRGRRRLLVRLRDGLSWLLARVAGALRAGLGEACPAKKRLRSR